MKFIFIVSLCIAVRVFSAEPNADQVLKAVSLENGLFVHLGAEDGSLVENLTKSRHIVAFAVAANEGDVEKLRDRLNAAGVYGQATAGRLIEGKRIPLIDELATAVIADLDGMPAVTRDEVLRVVRPLGKAYLKQKDRWEVVDKPRSTELDDWAQYFHDGAMSDLSKDKRAGPARGLQWQAGPSKTHSLGVRVIADVWVSMDENGLIARDAFNGLPLWRRPDLTTRNRFTLLVDSQRVYIYPEGERNLPFPYMLALDLRTGATVLEYKEGLNYEKSAALKENDPAAKPAFDLLRKRPTDMQARLDAGTLVQNTCEEMVALEAQSGKRLWSATAPEGKEWAHPLLANGRVYAVQGPNANSASYTHWPMTLVDAIVSLDLKTGKQDWIWEWSREMPDVLAKQSLYKGRKDEVKDLAPADKRVAAAYNMALAGDMLSLALRAELETTRNGKGIIRQLVIDSKTGKLKSYGLTPAGDRIIGGGHSHLRTLPIGENIWFLEATCVFGASALDDPTNANKFRLEYSKLPRPVGCTVFRASPNYLFGSLTTYALDGSGVQHTNVARTTCDVGAFPANGMTYITPNHCFCQPYVPGFNAFSPRKVQLAEELQRLELSKARAADTAKVSEDAWPMYLHDGLRSSWVQTQLPAQLTKTWSVQLAKPLENLVGTDWNSQWYGQGPVTGASIAEGVCVVALTDRQQIVALEPGSGKEKWRIVVDGRIDSQPTIHKGLVLAGTRTGWVYALNRDSGELVWRFFAAPRWERLVADGQLESPWPVFGTILADHEGVWAFAGRHNDCDGGLWWWRLNPDNGNVLSSGRTGVDELRTNTGSTGANEELPERFNGGNSPVVSNGKMMLLARIHLERKDGNLVPFTGLVANKGDEHVFWEKRFGAGILVPGNQGLLNRNNNLNGYKMSAFGFTQARQFAWNGNDFMSVGGTISEQHRGGDGGSMVRRFKRHDALQHVPFTDPKSGQERTLKRGAEMIWENKMDLARGTGTKAMAVAGDTVLVGLSVENRDRSKERERMPHRLIVFNYESGELRQELPLPAPVIMGGISAAQGRVFIVTSDGTLNCFAGGN